MQSSSAPSTTGEPSSASSRGSSSGPFVQPDQQSTPWYNDAVRPSQSQPREMIGPAPNFYNPNEAPVQDNHQPYQRWVDYVGQQQQTSQDAPLDHSFDQLYFQSVAYEQLGAQTQQQYPHSQSRGYGTIYGGLIPMTEGGAPSPGAHSTQHTSYGGTPEPTYQPPPTHSQPPGPAPPRGHHQPKPSYLVLPNQLVQPQFHGIGPQFERRAHASSDQPDRAPSTSAPWATDARQKKNTPPNTQRPRTRELPPPKTNRSVSVASKATPPQKPSTLTPTADAGDPATKRKRNDWGPAPVEMEAGSGDESDEFDIQVGVPGSSSANRKPRKAPRL